MAISTIAEGNGHEACARTGHAWAGHGIRIGATGAAAGRPSRTAAAVPADRSRPRRARLAVLQLRPGAQRLEPGRNPAFAQDRGADEAFVEYPAHHRRAGTGALHS